VSSPHLLGSNGVGLGRKYNWLRVSRSTTSMMPEQAGQRKLGGWGGSAHAAMPSVAGLVASIDPLLLRTLIDRALPQRNLRWALELAGAIRLCYFGRSALSAMASLEDFSIAQHCVREPRVALLDQVNKHSADYHEQTPTSGAWPAITQCWPHSRPKKC
jgi:hypothetical protein